jgi:hypothetical protein
MDFRTKYSCVHLYKKLHMTCIHIYIKVSLLPYIENCNINAEVHQEIQNEYPVPNHQLSYCTMKLFIFLPWGQIFLIQKKCFRFLADFYNSWFIFTSRYFFQMAGTGQDIVSWRLKKSLVMKKNPVLRIRDPE